MSVQKKRERTIFISCDRDIISLLLLLLLPLKADLSSRIYMLDQCGRDLQICEAGIMLCAFIFDFETVLQNSKFSTKNCLVSFETSD